MQWMTHFNHNVLRPNEWARDWTELGQRSSTDLRQTSRFLFLQQCSYRLFHIYTFLSLLQELSKRSWNLLPMCDEVIRSLEITVHSQTEYMWLGRLCQLHRIRLNCRLKFKMDLRFGFTGNIGRSVSHSCNHSAGGKTKPWRRRGSKYDFVFIVLININFPVRLKREYLCGAHSAAQTDRVTTRCHFLCWWSKKERSAVWFLKTNDWFLFVFSMKQHSDKTHAVKQLPELHQPHSGRPA